MRIGRLEIRWHRREPIGSALQAMIDAAQRPSAGTPAAECTCWHQGFNADMTFARHLKGCPLATRTSEPPPRGPVCGCPPPTGVTDYWGHQPPCPYAATTVSGTSSEATGREEG